MSTIEKDKISEQTLDAWPGIATAYDFVLPSYQWMIARLDAADNRIQTLLVFAASLMAVVAAIRTSNATFNSMLFILAVIPFVLLIALGAFARSWGALTLPDPAVHYNKWLHYPECEFKKNAIDYAGRHFYANSRLINKKGTIVTAMTWLFIVQALLLFFWAYHG